MVCGRDRGQHGKSRRAAKHLLGQHRVKLDAIELRPREGPGLVPDRVRDAEPPEVVNETCRADCVECRALPPPASPTIMTEALGESGIWNHAPATTSTQLADCELFRLEGCRLRFSPKCQ